MTATERPQTRTGFVYAGEAFRAERRRLGLSQRDLASVLDMDRNTVARIERGEAPVRRAILRLLSLLKSPRRSADKGLD